jgi:protein SCO1/2
MRRAAERFKAARIIMISVDGERDTPAVMKKYLRLLSPDFIGLTGNPAPSGKYRRAIFRSRVQGATGPGWQHNFFHSSQVFR